MPNVCRLANCPYMNPKDGSCNRYLVSDHCHLRWMNREKRGSLYKRIRTTQYFLYINESPTTIRFLKRQNQRYLRSDERFAMDVESNNSGFGSSIRNPSKDYISKDKKYAELNI